MFHDDEDMEQEVTDDGKKRESREFILTTANGWPAKTPMIGRASQTISYRRASQTYWRDGLTYYRQTYR